MKILLVRLRLIGDVVFTTPVLRALRRRFPQAQLTYVVEPPAAPIVIGNPHLDEVVVAPRRPGVGRLVDDLRLARQLRRQRYDIAIDLHGGPRSSWLTWASGAPRRIGYSIVGRTWMYTEVIPRRAGGPPRHSVLNQWDLVEPLGVGTCDPARDAVQMVEDPGAAERVRHRLRALGVEPTNPLAVVHVSAGNQFRRWPAESFVEVVCAFVARHPGRRVIVTSGPSEAAAGRRVADQARARLGESAPAILDPGEFDLSELRALIGGAAVYIGGDSGPMHIAATTRTPIVALFGATASERSIPWRGAQWFTQAMETTGLSCRPCSQWTCEPGDFRCLTRITPDQVVAAAEQALARPVSSADEDRWATPAQVHA